MLAFLAEINSRPGGGTLILEPGDYGEVISPTRTPVSGVVCIRRQPGATGFAHLGWSLDVESDATLTLRSVQLHSDIAGPNVAVDDGGLLFAERSGFSDGNWASYLSNAGFMYAVNCSFPETINNGVLIVYGGQITNESIAGGYDPGTGLDNSGYAFLDGVRLVRGGSDNYKAYGGAGIRNRASGVVSVTRSTIADNGSCCWYADACGNACGDGGILNTEGGYLEIAQSIVANNIEGDCFGPVTDLGYNVFGPGGGCTVTASTSIEADPLFVGEGDYDWFGPELGAGSPAIDLIPLELCPDTDALGRPRTDGNGDGIVACDAGALEFSGTAISVKSPPFWLEYGELDLATEDNLYVVLMSSALFDPADVVVESVIFGDTDALPRGWNYVDRNKDGVPDLRLRYRLWDLDDLGCGQQQIEVSASTTDGRVVAGLLKLDVIGCEF
jgi:hypothetical protein